MKSNYSDYSHKDSVDRIDEILAAKDSSFEELDYVPSRDKLTFTNGFYVKCSAVFIDLRESAKLPDKYTRPTLARIYRSFISECIAVINGNDKCVEVNIHGDAVWGIFDTPKKSDINSVFSTTARLNSLMKTLNCRYKKYKIGEIKAGIGSSWGRALMIKAGYKGSSINEVVWMGDVVNEAAHLSGDANKGSVPPQLYSNDFRFNLNETNQKMLSKNTTLNCYEGNIVNTAMDKWWKENCS